MYMCPFFNEDMPPWRGKLSRYQESLGVSVVFEAHLYNPWALLNDPGNESAGAVCITVLYGKPYTSTRIPTWTSGSRFVRRATAFAETPTWHRPCVAGLFLCAQEKSPWRIFREILLI